MKYELELRHYGLHAYICQIIFKKIKFKKCFLKWNVTKLLFHIINFAIYFSNKYDA